MTIGSQSTLGGFDPIGGQEAENIARSSSGPEVYQVTVAVVYIIHVALYFLWT